MGVTHLLWIGREQTTEAFQGFFTLIGEKLASQIEPVCSDTWQPYLDVIRQKCSQPLNILDRLPIVAKKNKALNEVRVSESRKMARHGREPPHVRRIRRREIPNRRRLLRFEGGILQDSRGSHCAAVGRTVEGPKVDQSYRNLAGPMLLHLTPAGDPTYSIHSLIGLHAPPGQNRPCPH